MRKLFERTVRTAVAMKLVDKEVQAVDGTKVVANASVNRSYDAKGLRGLLDRLERAIADLEAQNEAGGAGAFDHPLTARSGRRLARSRARHDRPGRSSPRPCYLCLRPSLSLPWRTATPRQTKARPQSARATLSATLRARRWPLPGRMLKASSAGPSLWATMLSSRR